MNERFRCEIIGATVTEPICEYRVARRVIDCAGCHKMNGQALDIPKEEIDVGAAPCGRPDTGQPQGIAPTT